MHRLSILALVFALACSDETALARQVGRKARSTDTLDGARTRLAVYHAQTAGFAALAAWYPTSLVVEVDARTPESRPAASGGTTR